MNNLKKHVLICINIFTLFTADFAFSQSQEPQYYMSQSIGDFLRTNETMPFSSINDLIKQLEEKQPSKKQKAVGSPRETVTKQQEEFSGVRLAKLNDDIQP